MSISSIIPAMPEQSSSRVHPAYAGAVQGRVRLQTLVLLRWLAILGQTAALLIVNIGLGYEVPLLACLAVVGVSALLNVVVSVRFPATKRLSDREAALYLGYDIVQLAVLLYLTGGLENPFAILFLVPVTISASTLTLRSTIALLVLSLLCVSLLAVYHFSLPWHAGGMFRLPPTYIAGIWVALVLGLGFMATYAWRVAAEAQAMSNALRATQLVLAREQRLSALDGLAAAAAHELGTPLATIAVTAKELQREPPSDPHLKEDLELIGTQAERCRNILATLSDRSQEDDLLSRMPLDALLNEAADPYRAFDVTIDIAVKPDESARPADAKPPIIMRRPEIMYGLGNLIENAADFAYLRVNIEAGWNDEKIRVVITDDGPGLSPDVIDKLGDPYVTTRPVQSSSFTEPEDEEAEDKGLGLGFFIAKTLLQRTGAEVTIANRWDGARGAVVRISWPRALVEADGSRQEGGNA